MSRAWALLVVAGAVAGCREKCEGGEGLFVAVEHPDGRFTPGVYELDVTLDEVEATVTCEVGDDGLVDYCHGAYPPTGRHRVQGLYAVDEGFSAMFFFVGEPDAICIPKEAFPQMVAVTVRRGDEVLATESWSPDYDWCRGGELCKRFYSSEHTIVLE